MVLLQIPLLTQFPAQQQVKDHKKRVLTEAAPKVHKEEKVTPKQ